MGYDTRSPIMGSQHAFLGSQIDLGSWDPCRTLDERIQYNPPRYAYIIHTPVKGVISHDGYCRISIDIEIPTGRNFCRWSINSRIDNSVELNFELIFQEEHRFRPGSGIRDGNWLTVTGTFFLFICIRF